MAIMIGELYDALVEAGCSREKARAASEAVYAAIRERPISLPPRRLAGLTVLHLALAMALFAVAILQWWRSP